jgi:hypothetical protein
MLVLVCITMAALFLFEPLYVPASRPRRGGWRQRRQQDRDEQPQEVASPSRLAMGHLLEWADGNQSAIQVQQHMANAAFDGVQDALVARLSNLGGSSRQHCHEHLMSLLGELPVLDVITPLTSSLWTHVILPSSWLRLLLRFSPRDFRIRFGADKPKVEAFWTDFFKRPDRVEWAQQHHFLRGKREQDLYTTIPLAIHEDCGPCTKKLSARCLSVFSVLGEGSEKLSHFLCASAIKVAKDEDDFKAWEAMLADFEALASGMIDLVDAQGVNWDFVLLFGLADEEGRCNDWGLPHYSSADENCAECLCNRGNRPYTDLQEGAAWRPTESMPYESYRARPRVPEHPLVASKFMSRWFLYPDLMRMMDCKGVSAICFGGITVRLTREPALGNNIPDRLKVINNKLAEHYRLRPGTHRLPRIAQSNLLVDGWAVLHGPAVKAANTRHASSFFKEVAAEYLSHGSAFDQHMASAARLLDEFYSILYAAPRFPDDDVINRLRSVCTAFGEAFMWCREYSRRDGLLWWEITSKVHKMQHVPMMAKIINPRHLQCYASESLIGTTTKVWKRSMSGRYKKRVQKVVLTKRVLGVLLRLSMPYVGSR